MREPVDSADAAKNDTLNNAPGRSGTYMEFPGRRGDCVPVWYDTLARLRAQGDEAAGTERESLREGQVEERIATAEAALKNAAAAYLESWRVMTERRVLDAFLKENAERARKGACVAAVTPERYPAFAAKRSDDPKELPVEQKRLRYAEAVRALDEGLPLTAMVLDAVTGGDWKFAARLEPPLVLTEEVADAANQAERKSQEQERGLAESAAATTRGKGQVPAAYPGGLPIRYYGRAFQVQPVPNLMETQRKFYADFLQADTPPAERYRLFRRVEAFVDPVSGETREGGYLVKEYDGLEAVFRETFPIESYDGTVKLEYLEYQINAPRFLPDECRALRLTYAGSLKIKVRLTAKVVVEEWVYLGEVPLMLGGGEFIVNGAERVIVTQLQRSPGVDFAMEMHGSGKRLHSCRIIPERGSWIQVEVTPKDVLTIRIDRSSKIAATTFLRALAPELDTSADILRAFHPTTIVDLTPTNKALLVGAVCVSEAIDNDTGEAVVATGARLTELLFDTLAKLGVTQLEVLGGFDADGRFEGVADELVLNTLVEDEAASHEDALKEIYRRLRPGTPVTLEKARELFHERFSDEKRYSFGSIGRFRLNRKFGIEGDDRMTLSGGDFLNICHYLLKLRADEGQIDDIDHLENRRVRTIKDLVMTELRNAMVKLRRNAREQMVIKGVGDLRAVVGELAGAVVNNVHNPDTGLAKGRVLADADVKALQKKYGPAAFDVKKRSLDRYVVRDPGAQKSHGLRAGQIIDEAATLAAVAADPTFDAIKLPEKGLTLVLDAGPTELREGMVVEEAELDRATLEYGPESVVTLNLGFEKGATLDVQAYKAYQERYGEMPGVSLEMVRPHQLLNPGTISSAIEYFFARGELSQVVDQTNPLSQLVHERRLSALGPGGLNRKRAGFEVRDVHTSHYGRICPVETPEGTNIGLIVSLANYAAVNDLGFLITPYFVVRNRKITGELMWLRADEEDGWYDLDDEGRPRVDENGDLTFHEHYIAQADVLVDDQGRIQVDRPMCRHREDFMQCDAEQITLVDVAPKQLVGISASLIPFLEHDDANRALMGSNMQRQAVPLVRADIPLIGTGMEREVVRNSGMVARAVEDGTVLYADSREIRVSSEELTTGERVYRLHKYKSLNDGTTLNQTPLVRSGDPVKRGDPLSQGAATKGGELALGKNTLVAFISWEGCNFEDAILVSEKLIRDDAFTSVHIEEFTCEIRETKVGTEEITRDIPGVSEAALAHLRDAGPFAGLVVEGTRVNPGDILVGKIAPKAKSEFSSEEKLLRAIFGRAGEDVKNDSLTVPPGTEGYVIGVKRFSKKQEPKFTGGMNFADFKDVLLRYCQDYDVGYDEAEAHEMFKHVFARQPGGKGHEGDPKKFVNRFVQKLEAQMKDRVVEEVKLKFRRLEELLGGDIVNRRTGKVLRVPRTPDYERLIELQEQCQWGDLECPAALRPRVKAVCLEHDRRIASLQTRCEMKTGRLRRGDELRAGVIELVKVYVAVKRKLSLGDKMAGRHGNKGVVARILPEEDMPFLEDGTAINMVLNPLGVPSRMNVGQILETHLGWAANTSGFRVVTPVFDGAKESDIRAALVEAGLPEDGKAVLYDGRTGEPFHEKVTVGYLYMLKLHHLVAEKIHARATGPYSLITQQPLGGKARNGGQRFGEMEVWAIEAYGAANILQELLTLKSDDVEGRTKIYEAMVKGESSVEPGMPVSFDVLCNEIRGIGLNIHPDREEEAH